MALSTTAASNVPLWFTTSGGAPEPLLLAGLYSCDLNYTTNTCVGDPTPVINEWEIDSNSEEIGINLWNVKLDQEIYSLYAATDAINLGGLTIVHQDLQTKELRTFFNQEQPPSECSDGGEYAFLEFAANSFAITDSGEFYIAWSGAVCDCSEPEMCSDLSNFKHTVAISQLDVSNDKCVMLSDNNAQAPWEACTTPVVILYDDCPESNPIDPAGNCVDTETNTSVTLSQSGFEIATLPSTGENVFFVSMLNNSYPANGPYNVESSVNELWVAQAGGGSTENIVQRGINPVPVDPVFSGFILPDSGTISINTDADGSTPNAVCRSAYNYGLLCSSVEYTNSGGVIVSDAREYLSANMLNETCFSGDSYLAPSVASGIEVSWAVVSASEKQLGGVMADVIYFGCNPLTAGVGNFASVDLNGNVNQVLEGAYPGSILWGERGGMPSTSSANVAGPVTAAALLLFHGFFTSIL